MIWIALVATAVICFASFTWAIYFYFDSPKPIPRQMRRLGLFGLVGFACELLGLVLGKASLLSLVGAAFILTSLSLFWYTVLSARHAKLGVAYAGLEPLKLVCVGPYRWVRHPFYSTYTLFWLGCTIASANLFLLIVPIIMGAFYWQAAKSEEAQLINSGFGVAYAEYMRRTGMFYPRLITIIR